MSDRDRLDDEFGGESSCYAHLLCPDCGVVLPTTTHRPECRATSQLSTNRLHPVDD